MGAMSEIAGLYAECIMDINSCSYEEAMDWVTSHTLSECRRYIEEHY
jgi:hypothetical protein